jgi:hypothetical protein
MAVSFGCIHDDVRAEPGSWLVVGMIPIFDKKKATRTGLRAEDGPNGASRRRITILHHCLGALLEGWNTLTDSNPDMNEMGRCWEDYSRSGSSMLRPRFGVTKTTMLHGQKAFPSLFRPTCLRVQLSGPHSGLTARVYGA